jgi:hypothetical protein
MAIILYINIKGNKRKGVMIMTKKNLILIGFTLFFFLIAIPVYSGMLDGKTFSGKNGHLGKDGSGSDEIKFENGKFVSVTCSTKYGFSDAEYTTKVDGDKVFFTADIYSDKYGRMTYSGYVKGDDISANYFWYDKGKYEKPEQVKWFKGSAKE